MLGVQLTCQTFPARLCRAAGKAFKLDVMPNVQQDLGLSDEQFGKLRLFNRILISYNDFKQAHEIASLLLDRDLYLNYPRENRQLVIALNMAAVVAYSRPTSRGSAQ